VKPHRALLIAVSLALAFCGKRGDPRPPVPIIPKATNDLVVTQRGSKVILTWSYPSLTTSGQGLHDIQRVVLYRTTEELPVPQGGRDPNTILPGDIDPTKPQPIVLFAKIPPLSNAQFVKLRNRLDSIEGAKLPAATAGAKLLYEDTPPFHTTDGRPIRLTYSVATESSSARSDLSNLISIVPIDVPAPPSAVAATAKAEGIVLKWDAPTKTVTSEAKPFIAGYNVYRTAPNAPEDVLAAPINTAPVTATTWTDTPAYGTFTYAIRTVAIVGPPRVESDLSAPVTATYKDLQPPPAPATVSALIETKAVRIVWDPVTAGDFAGYRVYRTEGVGQPEAGAIREAGTNLLTPKLLTTTDFLDKGVTLGIAFKYAVTAVDKSGNESPRTATSWVVVPKTP
jgi:hypothetical protein